MDELVKRRLLRMWLGVLYVTLWVLAAAGLLVVSTWLLGLWRYAAFAALGVALGAYFARRVDSLVERITQSILVLAAAGFSVWMAVSVARTPSALGSYALTVGTFVLYGAVVFLSIRFILAIVGTEEPRPEEEIVPEAPAVETKLEVVPEAEAETQRAAAIQE